MAIDIENYLDAYAIIAPQIYNRTHYRRTLARLMMTIFMMREDRKIKAEEIAFITKMTRQKFNLDETTAQALCEELCIENEYTPDIKELVAYIKENSTLIERADCIREMWEIAVCDDELHICEDKLAQRCGALLDVELDEVTWLKELAVIAHSSDACATS